jgi:hypothetical protein
MEGESGESGGVSDDPFSLLLAKFEGISVSGAQPDHAARTFSEIMSIPLAEARFFLEAAGYDLEGAINVYLNHGVMGGGGAPAALLPRAHTSSPLGFPAPAYAPPFSAPAGGGSATRELEERQLQQAIAESLALTSDTTGAGGSGEVMGEGGGGSGAGGGGAGGGGGGVFAPPAFSFGGGGAFGAGALGGSGGGAPPFGAGAPFCAPTAPTFTFGGTFGAAPPAFPAVQLPAPPPSLAPAAPAFGTGAPLPTFSAQGGENWASAFGGGGAGGGFTSFGSNFPAAQPQLQQQQPPRATVGGLFGAPPWGAQPAWPGQAPPPSPGP